MRTHRHFWALAAALLAACGDYGAPDEVLYGTAVYTQPKPGLDPSSLGTYWLDPIAKIVEDDPQNPTFQPLDPDIEAAIDQNMQGLGYAKDTSLTTPPAGTVGTVGLHVSVLKGTGAVYYPGYWCDYWYYYSCYYTWYYAGSYKYGTVMLEMASLAAPANAAADILWLAAMYGVQTSVAWDEQRVITAIDRAFNQSPYLSTR